MIEYLFGKTLPASEIRIKLRRKSSVTYFSNIFIKKHVVSVLHLQATVMSNVIDFLNVLFFAFRLIEATSWLWWTHNPVVAIYYHDISNGLFCFIPEEVFSNIPSHGWGSVFPAIQSRFFWVRGTSAHWKNSHWFLLHFRYKRPEFFSDLLTLSVMERAQQQTK